MSYTILKPTYMDSFQCKGAACRFTCCKEWDVTYSKSDYSKIRNVAKTPELKALVAEGVRREKNSGDERRYAHFEMDEQAACKMLDETGLCRLQKQCGHSVLPEVCRVFPRAAYLVEPTICHSCEAVCEAVIEGFFGLKDGISFISEERNGSVRSYFSKIITNEKTEQRPIYRYFGDILSLCIDTLQSRNYSLDDRVIIVGIILKKLHQMEQGGELDGIPAYVESMLRALKTDGLTASLSSLQIDRAPVVANAQMNLSLMSLLCKSTEQALMNTISGNLKIYIQMQTSNSVFQINDASISSFDLGQYDKAQALYREYMKTHEYVMENLMVNTFFGGAYPFNGELTIWQSYMRFASIYSLYKYAAAGVMLSDPSDEAFVHTIAVLSRGLLHRPWFAQFIVDRAQDTGTDTLAHFAIMVKS